MALEDAKTQIDHAFMREDARGLSYENAFAGAVSFLRRKYTKDLSGVDLAITGVPFDQAVTNRTGTRLGPRAARGSTLQPYDPPYGWGLIHWANLPSWIMGIWPLTTQRCPNFRNLTPISNRSCPKMYQPSPWVGIITSRFPFLRPMPKSLAHRFCFAI